MSSLFEEAKRRWRWIVGGVAVAGAAVAVYQLKYKDSAVEQSPAVTEFQPALPDQPERKAAPAASSDTTSGEAPSLSQPQAAAPLSEQKRSVSESKRPAISAGIRFCCAFQPSLIACVL